MNKNNYYDILDIDPKATFEQIKKKYRQLSLQTHPDRGGDAEEFQKINEAYEILSDEDKRRMYDMENTMFSSIPNAKTFFQPVNEDFINILFQNDLNNINSFSSAFPNISMLNNKKNNCYNVEKPQNINKSLKITLEQAYTGCIVPLQIERKNNKTIETETVYVTVPQGVDNNEYIMIEGKGNIEGELAGNVKVIIVIINDSQYNREGLDIIYNHEVPLKNALCGFEIEIPHFSGKMLKIKNTPGNIVSSSYKKIIEGLGFKRDGHVGRLIITFNVLFPTSLTTEQINTIKDIL